MSTTEPEDEHLDAAQTSDQLWAQDDRLRRRLTVGDLCRWAYWNTVGKWLS